MSALRGFAQPQVYGGAVEVGEERGQLGGGYRGDRLPVIDPVELARLRQVHVVFMGRRHAKIADAATDGQCSRFNGSIIDGTG